MSLSLDSRMKSGPAAAGRLVAEVFRDLAPKVLFFFSAFGLFFLLFKLFVAQYSIEYWPSSKPQSRL